MKIASLQGSLKALSVTSLTAVFVPSIAAQDLAVSTAGAQFEAPQRIMAGEAFLGAKRMYPSPTFQDVNGDKQPDIVIGDLFGRLTFAARDASSEVGVSYGAEKSMKDRSGERLKFHNW